MTLLSYEEKALRIIHEKLSIFYVLENFPVFVNIFVKLQTICSIVYAVSTSKPGLKIYSELCQASFKLFCWELI